jgi:hypothetical protein
LLRWTAQQNEAPPAEFYCSLEEGVPERVALAVFGFPQRREVSMSKLSGFCSSDIRNTKRTSGNRFFALAVFFSRRAPCGYSALQEFLLLEEILCKGAPGRVPFKKNRPINEF